MAKEWRNHGPRISESRLMSHRLSSTRSSISNEKVCSLHTVALKPI